MKKKQSAGFYALILGAVLSVAGLVTYGSVRYTMSLVRYFLIAAVVLAAVVVVLTFTVGYKSVFSAVTVINAALMAAAAVYGASLMVNQIGYVIAGLDEMSTINSFITYTVITVISMLVYIVASFLPMAKEA